MFETITGHEQNKEFLRRLLARDKRPHSLLFYGPEGMGKRLLALEFAKALLCLAPDKADRPCGVCESRSGRARRRKSAAGTRRGRAIRT